MLLGDSKIGTSTLATTSSSTRAVSKPQPKKKDNFIIYSFKRIWSLLTAFWIRFRKFMWIGSTGIFYINKQHRFYHISRPIRIFIHAINAK